MLLNAVQKCCRQDQVLTGAEAPELSMLLVERRVLKPLRVYFSPG